MRLARPTFASRREYGERFTDPAFWRPYVEEVCRRHALPAGALRAGLPGTNPVFLVGGCVVKLYTDMLGGAQSYPAERECYRLVAEAGDLPAPALVASGDLFPEDGGGWTWPYIVTTLLPGLSLGESQVAPADMPAVAAWLGGVLRRIHALPLAEGGALPPDGAAYRAFLEVQRAEAVARHAAWGALPPHLLADLEAFLPPAAELADAAGPPRLVHGDLNRDHVLGLTGEGGWRPTGVIDFGDARAGDPAYDLIALHVGLLGCDTRLLGELLRAYGSGLGTALPRRAMALTLLHEFTIVDEIPAELLASPDLAILAERLWRVSP